MITEETIKVIIVDSLRRLIDSNVIAPEISIDDQTPLIGTGGNLDSIAFMDLATEVEERIEQEVGGQFVLRLQEIHDLHDGKKSLALGELARVLTTIVNRQVAGRSKGS